MKSEVCRLIGVCLLLAPAALGERRPLDPPPLVEFHLEEHIDEAYRAAIESLETAAACFDDGALSGPITTFRETLDQQRLQEAGQALTLGLDDYRWNSECPRSESAAREELREKIEQILAIVNRGRYLADPLGVPVQFEIDRERRLYRVSWREWEGDVWTGGWRGPEVVKEIPFVPKVVAVVEATYEDGGYGYEVFNSAESQGSLSRKLEIEGVGVNRTMVKMHENVPLHRREFREHDEIFWFSYPGAHYLQNFGLFLAGGPRTCEPGQRFTLPPRLKTPWRELPGVVGCWAPIADWDPPELSSGLDPEIDPPNVGRMFWKHRILPGAQLGPKKELRFAYHGKTIGPVPVPQPGERAEFAERIRGYFQDARDWGWVKDEAWAQEIEEKLGQLRSADLDPRLVLELIQEVDEAYESGRLLHEAHVLLKYNLEYLADPDNWASEE